MSEIKAVLFDLDGTLVDTAPDFYQTLDILLQRHGKEKIAHDIVRAHVSDGSRALTKLAFPEVDNTEAFESLRLELLDIYKACVGDQAILFPEMKEILAELARLGLPWGIVTNKPRLYTELLIERTTYLNACSVLVCADDVPNAKPDPEGIILACNVLNTAPKNTLYIGDHKRDVDAAKNAHCPSAIFPLGYFDDVTDITAWGADYTIESAFKLRKVIQTKMQDVQLG